MKTIITSLLLLLCLSVSAQGTIERIILRAYSTMDANDRVQLEYREKCRLNDIKDSIRIMSIPQSEINLGLHKFKKQHITGNHLIIAGIISTVIGSLVMIEDTGDGPIKDLYYTGIFLMSVGGGLTTAGFIVNIDSFRHIK